MIRRNMHWGAFWGHISTAFVVSVIVILTFSLISAFVTMSMYQDGIKERDLYLAVSGEVVDNDIAMETAEVVRRMYSEQLTISYGSVDELFELYEKSYRPNSLKFALNHWDKIVAIIEDSPDVDTSVTIPKWLDWFKFIVLGSFLFLSVSLSTSFVAKTMSEHRFRGEEVWQYPWHKWWAYPLVLLMIPYFVVIQPPSLIYMLCRRLGGLPVLDPSEAISRARQFFTNLDKEKQTAIDRINSARKNTQASREQWAEVCSSQRIHKEKGEAEDKINLHRSKLSTLAGEIELNQRALAKAQARLKEIEYAIEHRSSYGEYMVEFDEILSIPHVAAVEVVNNEVRVYTEMIYISRGVSTYEMGIFMINITDQNFGIKSIYSSYGGGGHPHMAIDGHFCFGNILGEVRDLYEKRNYPRLIGLIIQALRTYSPSGGPFADINKWKKVRKKEAVHV